MTNREKFLKHYNERLEAAKKELVVATDECDIEMLKIEIEHLTYNILKLESFAK